VTTGAPDGSSSKRSRVGLAGPAAAPLAPPLVTGARSFSARRASGAVSTTSPSSSPVEGSTPPGAAVGSVAWLA